MIDALLEIVERIDTRADLRADLEKQFSFLDPKRPLLLVTGHRRENFGAPFESLCTAIVDLVRTHEIQVVYPVHLNPNVQAPVNAILGDNTNIHLIEPQDYLPFVYLLKR